VLNYNTLAPQNSLDFMEGFEPARLKSAPIFGALSVCNKDDRSPTLHPVSQTRDRENFIPFSPVSLCD